VNIIYYGILVPGTTKKLIRPERSWGE